MLSHDDAYGKQRRNMVKDVLRPNHITDFRILDVMGRIPRHYFLPIHTQSKAYKNQSHLIGYKQQIAAPLFIAQLLQSLKLTGTETILEVGTGTGYLTSLLMALGHYVFSLETVLPLAETAADCLYKLGLHNVDLHIGDGSQGLPDMATFDVIVVTASLKKIPKPLAQQLHPRSGRMIAPVITSAGQYLQHIRRQEDKWFTKTLIPSNYLPLVGRFGNKPADV